MSADLLSCVDRILRREGEGDVFRLRRGGPSSYDDEDVQEVNEELMDLDRQINIVFESTVGHLFRNPDIPRNGNT